MSDPDAHTDGTKARADLFRGRLRLHRAHSIAFLSASNIVHAIMRKSECWCVDGEATFVLRIRGDDYYRIELPGRAEADGNGAEELKGVLSRILMYEKTLCPFARGFTVDLPGTPELPAGKRKWRPAEAGSGTPLVEYSHRDLRLAFPEHRSPNAGAGDSPPVGFGWRDGPGTPSRPPRTDPSGDGSLSKPPRPRASASIRSVTVPALFLESSKPPALPSELGMPPTPPPPPPAEASDSRGLGRLPTENVDGRGGGASAAQDRPLPGWDRSASNSPCSPLQAERPAPEQVLEPPDAVVPPEAPGPWQVDGSVSDSAADARARTPPRPATAESKVQEPSTPARQTRVGNDGASDPDLALGAQISDVCSAEASAVAADAVDLADILSPFDPQPTSAGYRSDSRSASISSAVVLPMVMSSTRPGLSAIGAGTAPSSPDVASARRVLSSLSLSRTRPRSSARPFLPRSPSPSPKSPSTPASARFPSSGSSSCSTSFYSTKPLQALSPETSSSSSPSSTMSPVTTTTTIILAQRTCSLVFHTSTQLIHTMLSIARRIMDGALRDIFIGFSEGGDKIPCQWDFDDSDYDVEDDAQGSADVDGVECVAHRDGLDTEALSAGDEHRGTGHAVDDPPGLDQLPDPTTDDTSNVPKSSNSVTRSKVLTSSSISKSRTPSTVVNGTCNGTCDSDETRCPSDADADVDPDPAREGPSTQAAPVDVRERGNDSPAAPKHKGMEMVDEAPTRPAPSARSTPTVSKDERTATGTDAPEADAREQQKQQQQQDPLVRRTRRPRRAAARKRGQASSASETFEEDEGEDEEEEAEHEEEHEEAGVNVADEWASASASGLSSTRGSQAPVDWALDVD